MSEYRANGNLEFFCPHCSSDLSVPGECAGEWVACPSCNTLQVALDPLLPIGSELLGHSIHSVAGFNLFENIYGATNESNGEERVLKTISQFVSKHCSDFPLLFDQISKIGKLNYPDFSHLVEGRIVGGMGILVYDLKPETRSLATVVGQAGPIYPYHALEIIRRICSALRDAFNYSGVSHINLNQKNLRIAPDMSIEIFDYGISERLLANRSLLAYDFDIWSHKFCAPEIIQSKTHYGPRSDIYSIGALLHFMLTGQQPHGEAELAQTLGSPPSDPRLFTPSVPPVVAGMVCDMLANTPSARPSGWDEAIERIQEALRQVTPAQDVEDTVTNTNPFKKLPKSMAKTTLECDAIPQKGRRMPGYKAPEAKQRSPQGGSKKPRPASKAVLQKAAVPVEAQKQATMIWLGVGAVLLLVAVGVIVASQSNREPPRRAPQRQTAWQQQQDAPPAAPAQPEPASTPAPPDATATAKTTQPAPSPAQPDKPGEPAAKTGTSTAAYVKPAALPDMLKDADDFAKNNPDDLDGIVERYNATSEEARSQRKFALFGQIDNKLSTARTKYDAVISKLSTRINYEVGPLVKSERYQDAYDLLSQLKTEQKYKEAIAKVDKAILNVKLMELKKKVAALQKTDGLNKALHYIDSYSGDLADETKAERAKLVAEMVCEDLRKNAKKLAVDGKVSEAKELLTGYSGLLSKETAAFREELATKIPELQKEAAREAAISKATELLASFDYDAALELLASYQPAELKASDTRTATEPRPVVDPQIKELVATIKKEKEAVTAAFGTSFTNVAPHIAALDFPQAEKAISALTDRISNAQALELAKSLLENVKAMRNFDVEILKLLAKPDRREISFLDGEVEKNSVISEVRDGKIFLPLFDSGKNTGKQKAITPDRLTLRTKLELAGAIGLRNSRLLKGMLSWREGEFGKAKAHLLAVPVGLGKDVVVILEELDAEKSFAALLDKNALAYTKGMEEDFLKRLDKINFPPDKARRITQDLQRLRTLHADAKYFTTAAPVIDAILKKCQRKDAPSDMEMKFEVSVKDGPEFVAAIRAIPPQTKLKLKSGSYDCADQFQISAKNVAIEGEADVVLMKPLEINNASSVAISNLRISPGGLSVKTSSKIDLINIVVDTDASRITASQEVSLSNCLLRGLEVVGTKNTMLDHCTILSSRDPSLRLGALWLRDDSGTRVLNSLINGDRVAICFTALKTAPPAASTGIGPPPPPKRELANTLLNGAEGLAAEVESTGVAITPKGFLVTKLPDLTKAFKPQSNIAATPKFINPDKGDYSLLPETDGTCEGSDGRDCGFASSALPKPSKETAKDGKDAKDAGKAADKDKK